MSYERTDEIALIFDTETTDLPRKLPLNDPKQPHILQIGLMLAQRVGSSADYRTITEIGSTVVLAKEAKISPYAQKVHGISKEFASLGMSPIGMCNLFNSLSRNSSIQVAHNLAFDSKLLATHYARYAPTPFKLPNPFCTMLSTVKYCNIPGRWNKPKWPKLEELHQKLFGETFAGAHDALSDVRATARCYFEITSEGFEL